jgi:hypothetical protein
MSQLATISALHFASKLCERPDSWDFVSVLYTWEGKMSSVQKLVLVLSCDIALALAKVLFLTCIWLFAQIVH